MVGQTKSLNNRQKVGLVLSGGGAKGLAHIGVLKVIDSLGVKIDYIAGTSMGAIIGALYASGYSGHQIDSVFQNVTFNKILNDDLPRESVAISERVNTEKYAVKLPFDNFKIKLPSALLKGHKNYNLLLRLTLHTNQIRDFSDLPIPFFCIATDIETGEQAVLEHGNLTQSIVASAALPSLFQPVVIDDRIFIDGGVVNNYPVDVMREKGMDVIIGVDVQDRLLSRQDLNSAPGVMLQINNFRNIKDMKVKVNKTDVYIKPNIERFNMVSFAAGNKIIKEGEKAALSQLERLKTLEVKQKMDYSYSIPQAIDSLTINKFQIYGNQKYTRAYILGKLKIKSGEKIPYHRFNKGINSLAATNNFDVFEYELLKSVDRDGFDFVTHLKESKGNTFLKLGLHFDDLYKSAALINLTKKQMLFKNDLASLDIILGDNVRYNFEYLIDKGFYWSIGIRSRFNEFNTNVTGRILDGIRQEIPELNNMNIEFQDHTNQIYLQTHFRKDFDLSFGGEHKRLKAKSENFLNSETNEVFIFDNTDYLGVFGTLKLDTYDDKYFPTKGVYFNGDIHAYLYASGFQASSENFSVAKADIGYAFSQGDKLAFNIQASGGFQLTGRSSHVLEFALGGYGNDLINNFIPFVGYDFVDLTGNSYIKAAFRMDYEMFNKNHLIAEANWANVEDDLFESSKWFSLPEYSGFALGYALETFLGPLQVTYSFSPETKRSLWFFNMGFWF